MTSPPKWAFAIGGALFGACVTVLLFNLHCEKAIRDARIDQAVTQAAMNLQVKIRLLEAIRTGNTNSASFLLEMGLDGDIITLYTIREQATLNAAGQTALTTGISYRKVNQFVRKHNNVDRGDLVEDTIERILKGERISQ